MLSDTAHPSHPAGLPRSPRSSQPLRPLLLALLAIAQGGIAHADDPGVQIYADLAGPPGAAAGNSLGYAGDFTGDGIPDVLVGDGLMDLGGFTNAGQVYLYPGGASISSVPAFTFNGEGDYDYFGRETVTGIGDFNADGWDDVAVGAPSYSGPTSGYSAGRAYVYFGGPSADNTPDWIVTGVGAPSNSDFLGQSIASVDYNGDDQVDLVVGTFGPDKVYIYHGGPSPDTVADVILTGPDTAQKEFFGVSASSAGDFNGDTYEDLCIGAYKPSPGKAFVYFGGPGADTVADVVFTGDALGFGFGGRVAGLGDMNGDGIDDLAVSDWSWTSFTQAGRVSVYLGGAPPDAVEDLALTGEANGDYFGYGLAAAGDVDGDGRTDLLVGARHHASVLADAGRAYLYLGGNPLDSTADYLFDGARSGDEAGSSVAGAGDLNGDGRADFLIGIPGHDDGVSSLGRTVALGAPDPTDAATVSAGGGSLTVWPNPLPPGRTATLRFGLHAGGGVTAELFDVRGRRVHSRSWAPSPGTGARSVSWRPAAPGGVYFVRVRSDAGRWSETQRWILLR
jgi:hypothetical protein